MCPGSRSARVAGCRLRYTFAQDGEYDIQIWLARDRTGSVERPERTRHRTRCTLLLDRTPIGTLTVQRPADGDDSLRRQGPEGSCAGDGRPASAGRHVSQEFLVAARNGAAAPPVALQREASSPSSLRRFPRCPSPDRMRPKGADDTPSRRRIFVCRPTDAARGRGVREEDSLHPDAARVPPADLRSGSEAADGLLSGRTVRRRLRRRNRAGA